MSQRERQASGTVSEPAPRPAGGHPAALRPQPAQETAGPPLHWEDYFRTASPARQKELLALATRHGIVYAHQLAPHGNGAADPARHFLSQLLAGRLDDLEAVSPVQGTWIDQALDEDQREAVVKALGTPDLCLIQGLPGSGKTRVITELATQAVQRGQRVLLLSQTAAAIDRVLEQIGARDTVAPIRCLGRDEQPENLPPAVRALTCAERLRCLNEQAAPAARRQVEEAEEHCRRRERDEPVLARLLQLAERGQQLTAQQAQLHREREQVPGEVERQAQAGEDGSGAASDPVFGPALLQAVAERKQVSIRIEAAQAELRQRAADRQKELDEVLQQLASLVPVAEAKQQGRWWSWSWWQAASQGDVVGKLTELETRKQQLEKDLAALTEAGRTLAEEMAAAEQGFVAKRAACCQVESERRQRAFDARLQVVQGERAQLEEQWREQECGLDAATPRPQAQTPAALQSAQDACRQQHEQEKRQAAFAREWAVTLEQQAPTFGQQLVRQANLVAATAAALAADPQFGDASGQSFDLVILDEAHLIVEAEWLPLARRARRWVLVGEPAWDRKEPAAADQDRAHPSPQRDLARPAGRGTAGSRVTPAVPRLFPRLWRQLHADPRRLPYAWFQEDGRWCCRLRELTPEQRSRLESECVADRPDIELRIFAEPRLAPVLAEVAFPASMSIPQAKEYIYRELQELPVQALGSRIRWSEEPGRLVLQLSDAARIGTVPIDLEPGVREMVVLPAGDADGHGAQRAPNCTHCLEFDGTNGWTRRRAEDWVRAHLGIRDLGRTAQLDVPHRMHPDLAAFVSHLLFDDAYRLARRSPAPEHLLGVGAAAPLEFIAVTGDAEPAARLGDAARGKQENGRRSGSAVRPRPSRGGAGLETDLSDPRYRERLPAELRGDLPAQGFVNCAEAQAVVRVLESLAQHPESTRWHVGVSALYPAQVQLIRNLVRQSAALKNAPFELRIDEPWAFRSRECQVMLLSLTRSHSHRAVTFGEGPHLFGLALTRARAKLILFGDTGTLHRRCQWDGPVDHLDAAAAGRERELLHRLLQSLPGDGTQPRALHLREGQCS